MRASGVTAGYDQICPDMALIPEEVLFQHCHACCNAGFSACRKSMQFEVGGCNGSSEFGISSSTSTGTPDVGCNVVQLLAILPQ
jgi:hypothetical protein